MSPSRFTTRNYGARNLWDRTRQLELAKPRCRESSFNTTWTRHHVSRYDLSTTRSNASPQSLGNSLPPWPTNTVTAIRSTFLTKTRPLMWVHTNPLYLPSIRMDMVILLELVEGIEKGPSILRHLIHFNASSYLHWATGIKFLPIRVI